MIGARSQKNKVEYRVSRTGGWLMMAVAMVLDFLPFIMLLVVVGFIFSTVAGSGLGSVVGFATKNHMAIINKSCPIADAPRDPAVMNVLAYYNHGMACANSRHILGAGVFVGGLLGFFAGFWIFPVIYILSTAFAGLLALFLFPVWFYFGKNYIMVSFTHPHKVVVNLSSFMIATILKWTPLLNILPFPVYTFTVWKHIQISRTEDRETMAEKNKERVRLERENARQKARRMTSARRSAQVTGRDESFAGQEGYIYA